VVSAGCNHFHRQFFGSFLVRQNGEMPINVPGQWATVVFRLPRPLRATVNFAFLMDTLPRTPSPSEARQRNFLSVSPSEARQRNFLSVGAPKEFPISKKRVEEFLNRD